MATTYTARTPVITTYWARTDRFFILREDGFFLLREDWTKFLREDAYDINTQYTLRPVI